MHLQSGGRSDAIVAFLRDTKAREELGHWHTLLSHLRSGMRAMRNIRSGHAQLVHHALLSDVKLTTSNMRNTANLGSSSDEHVVKSKLELTKHGSIL